MDDVQSWTAGLADAVLGVAQVFFAYLPSVLGAVLLLLVGWLTARALRRLAHALIERLLERLARQRVARTKAIDARMQRSEAYQSVPLVVGAIVQWTVLLLFIAAAIEALGLPAVSEVIGLITAYLPRVLAAVVIVFAGLWAGELTHTVIVRGAGRVALAYAPLIGRAMQVLVVLVFVIVAIGQLGIDSTILVVTLAIVLGASFGAAALAFGLGARTVVSNILASRYVRRQYEVGDTVSIGDSQGRIVEISDTTVILETPGGRATVPAARFMEDMSMLVERQAPS